MLFLVFLCVLCAFASFASKKFLLTAGDVWVASKRGEINFCIAKDAKAQRTQRTQ